MVSISLEVLLAVFSLVAALVGVYYSGVRRDHEMRGRVNLLEDWRAEYKSKIDKLMASEQRRRGREEGSGVVDKRRNREASDSSA